MKEELYTIMNWSEIEAIVYSEHDEPHQILGAHLVEDGVLIQGFFPSTSTVTVLANDKEYLMELVDEEGFYAVVLPYKKIPKYKYHITFEDGTVTEKADPYLYKPIISDADQKKFNAGIHYEIYEKLGSHIMKVGDTVGVLFAVWAPMAVRVSVVGDFNGWDGRTHPMRRLGNSGIHELFIPSLKSETHYKYEIKAKGGLVFLKADPYAKYAQLRPDTASIVYDINQYIWSDKEWMRNRKSFDTKKNPMLIYEMHLGSWKRPEDGREFYNYREIAPLLVDYIKEMGYTHVELMPIMEHPYDGSWGYQVTGYYATTSRYGRPEDFMYLVDLLHQNGIGVILDWVPAHFPKDTFGLAGFDGTCLYEHKDPRQGEHPHWGTLIYNYARPEVSNFLIANALFWIEKYHIDGIRVDAVASMLYLDYGKNDGEWVANIYGGNENLEAIEFLKHLNSIIKKRKDGAVLIAEESTAWPNVTGPIEEGSLGFDYKWNMGWMNDFLEYMKCDPYFRNKNYHLLTFSMIYAYSEDFILSLSHDEVVHEKASLLGKMPGDTLDKKFNNLRVLYGFMMTHPGKKLLFMGQDLGQLSEWSEAKSVEWELLESPENKQFKEYLKALNKLYVSNKALYGMDYEVEGFEWINNISANENIVVFLRKTERKEDTLLIVCNFAPVTHTNYKIGVPYRGKYKEIFNSDKIEFGGNGEVNPRLKQSKKSECDDRTNSISIKVPPMGMSIFHYRPVEEEVIDNKAAKAKKVAAKKTSKQVEKIKKEIMKESHA